MIVQHAPSLSSRYLSILLFFPLLSSFYRFVFALRLISVSLVLSLVADSQDVDLDAILGELCALERRCDGDIASTPAPDSQRQGRPNSTRITAGDNTDIGKNEGGTYDFLSFFLSRNLSRLFIRMMEWNESNIV